MILLEEQLLENAFVKVKTIGVYVGDVNICRKHDATPSLPVLITSSDNDED